MKFKNIFGKEVNKNINKYLIDWEKPCKSKVQFNVKKFTEPYWGTHVVVEEFPVFGPECDVTLLILLKKLP